MRSKLVRLVKLACAPRPLLNSDGSMRVKVAFCVGSYLARKDTNDAIGTNDYGYYQDNENHGSGKPINLTAPD